MQILGYPLIFRGRSTLVALISLADSPLFILGIFSLESSLQAEELRPGSSPGLYSHE